MSNSDTQLLDFFKALADESRLKIVGVLAQQPRSVEELARLLDLGSPTISHHLGKLQKAGLVRAEAQQYYNVYSLNTEQLQNMAQSLLKPGALTQASNPLESNPDALVAKLMIEPGRIAFKSKGRDLLLVMEWLREKFEKDVSYTEPQINSILETYCMHEPITVRRYMADLKMLARKRDGSLYWRVDSPQAQLPNFDPDGLPKSSYQIPARGGIRPSQLVAVQGYVREGRVKLPDDERGSRGRRDSNSLRNSNGLAAARLTTLQFVWRLMAHRFNKELTYSVEQVDAVIQHYFHDEPAEVRALLLEHEYLHHDAKQNTFTLKNDTAQYDQRVLAGFLVDGRLKDIPAQLKKRQAVLRWLIEKFELRKRYTEKQVNDILKQVHDDFASLRRYLIGEGFLDRKDGMYWRIIKY
jgi:DNA-binding HxlR family transcriptional regulator